MNLFTNAELWALIYGELNDTDNYPLVSANLMMTATKGRVTYRVQHPKKKIPVMRQVELNHRQISYLTDKLREQLRFPKHVAKVEINLCGNETIEPFIRYTVQPVKN